VATAAIDFGGTVTDVVLRVPGEADLLAALPAVGAPELSTLPRVLDDALQAARGADAGRGLPELDFIAVTGGRSRDLPERCGALRLIRVEEPVAIAAGGVAAGAPSPTLVVSLGTGTAIVVAEPPAAPRQLVGSGIGGGTLIGLARLLLGTGEVEAIGKLSLSGDASRCDMSVGDILGGGIGPVPASATAAHFARVGRSSSPDPPSRADIAAALVNLVSQAVLRLAFEAAMGHGARSIVLLGHVLDVPGFREAIARIPRLDPSFVRIVDEPGFAVARGALSVATQIDSRLKD
jgi:type II pantothenate kinase